MRPALAIVAFSTALAGSTWGQDTRGPTGMYNGGNERVQYARPIRAASLSGTVADITGVPVPGARVQVQAQGQKVLIVDIKAGERGGFRLPQLRRGNYWIGISAYGFDLHVWELHIVRFGGSKKLNARLHVGT